MSKTLLVMGNMLLPAEMEELEQHFELIRLYKEKDPESVLQERCKEISGIVSMYYTPITQHLIEALPNLEIISQFAVGTNNIDLEAAKKHDIAVTNTPDVLSDDTADIALSLLLAVTRRIVEGDVYLRLGKWYNGQLPLGVCLNGKTAGIVGLGRIGQAIAKRCEGFGIEVVYHGPREKPDQDYKYYADLSEMARDCDFLILACPGNDDTVHLVNADILDALGPQGFLINISRGTVVDEEALVTALHNRSIAGAALDVYENEPHVPEPLISMDNVVLLPHIGSATFETRTIMGQLVVQNLLAYFNGKPLLTRV